MKRFPSIAFLAPVVCLVHIALVSAQESEVQFARDIQPLLAKHCLLCHGPDDSEGGLRLHSPEYALAKSDSGMHAIVSGKPDASELIKRITSDDPDLRMPPEGDGLSTPEIEMLREWIAEGANWEVHWAYRALDTDPPPQVTMPTGNEIDHFVAAKLDEADIAASPRADRFTLIKRLYYDLIGLPPKPEDVDAFSADSSEQAYEKLVDRLLASEHFGERWGRHWLDKARYADSDGYEKDNHRADAWRYRDWVIQAINDDMPFDQFTIQQLAGDMLPEARPMSNLATAFHRQTLTNTEGGTDREQWRVAAVMDRTETVGTVWLGLSVGCARCHNHKYDQISQKEYYQLYAYFNNGDETNTQVPTESTVNQAKQHEREKLAEQITARKTEIADGIDQWLPDLKALVNSAANQPIEVHSLENITIKGREGVKFEKQDDASWLVTGKNSETAKYTIEGTSSVGALSGIRVEALPDDSLSAKGPGRTKHGNFVLNEVRLYASAKPKWGQEEKRTFASADADFSQDKWPAKNAIDGIEGSGSSGTGWAISPQFGKAHQASFYLDQPLKQDETHLHIVLNQTYGSQHTIGRFRISLLTGTPPDAGIPKEIIDIVQLDAPDKTQTDRLIAWKQSEDKQLRELTKKLDSLADPKMSVRVISQRRNNPRKTHVLRRGEFKQPMEEVQTATLMSLPPISARGGNATSDRLDLAKWLVNGNNPLVPRVVANQIWKNLFGAGIVPTINDFGVRGDPPSHPRLLDHLANKLIDEKWSRKSLIKHIVMSATYQQSSRHRPELVAVDPSNRLLHRQNRFRVEAEIIRDISLAASGLLSSKVGGPSVFPPIPAGVTDLTYNSSFKWKTSSGEDRYRRGMYTYFKRTAPHPNLITFDCPDSNVTNVNRDRSNTPIGALVTLNNESFVEAAQAMAQQVLDEQSNDDRSRLQSALRSCIVRQPSDAEIGDFAKLLELSRDWYSRHQDAAKSLVGDRRVEGVPIEENAAWFATLRMILNLDEFITRE
ncbi:MAG: PSD1 and planctomycete cytochrome C domain-containing protein [Planctomycetota bacterium]